MRYKLTRQRRLHFAVGALLPEITIGSAILATFLSHDEFKIYQSTSFQSEHVGKGNGDLLFAEFMAEFKVDFIYNHFRIAKFLIENKHQD